MARETLALRALLAQRARKVAAQLAECRAAARREAVQCRAGAHAERGEVEDLIADGDAAARRLRASLAPEDAEGQVLDREVAARGVRRLDPAGERRVVRLVKLNL